MNEHLKRTPAETAAALEESIEHWFRLSTGKARPGERCTSGDCALCRLFLKNNCEGCPVMEATGEPYCVGTPYGRAATAMAYGVLAFVGDARLTPKFLEAAEAELDFLRSLRKPQPKLDTLTTPS